MKTISLLCSLVFGLALPAQAHDPGLSTLTVQVRPDEVEATVVLAVKDASLLIGGASSEPAIQSAAAAALEMRLNGRQVRPDDLRTHTDANNNFTMDYRFIGAAFTQLSVRAACLENLPPGHRQFLTIRSINGEALQQKLLRAGADSAEVEVGARPGASVTKAGTAGNFLLLGVKHILTGYDHLLFLFSLLVVTTRASSALKIITAFTFAHSITLTLAALDLVRVPAGVVEPIIAGSIIFVGVENLLRAGEPKGRVPLTFVFGLVHGLGFASALRESGLDASGAGIVLPLVSFNGGVELGQLLVAALVLPLMWRLAARPPFAHRLVPVGSAVVILAGSFWLVQRLWPA
jgi:hydrogenase/urease accessory protein HupE